VALYAALGFFLVPFLVRHYLPRFAAEPLKRQASIGEVRFNPFVFTFEAKDFAFREADGEPILGFKRLYADFELASLYRWAWTFADLRIEVPSVNLVVDREGRLNLARIADDLPQAEEPKEPVPPPRLLLKHAALVGGVLNFTDRSNPTPAEATLEPLYLEINDISTLPEHRGPYGIAAKLPGGGSIAWEGEVFLHPLASNGTVRIKGFRPATAWRFFQDQLRLAEPGGEMDVDAPYRFAYAQGKTTLTADSIKIAVRDLALTEDGASFPILELASVEIPDARFDFGSRELVVPTLAIRDGGLATVVKPGGDMNWATLIKSAATTHPPQPEAAPAPATPVQPWKLRVDSLTVDGVALSYRDASRATPIAAAVGSSRLSLAATAEIGGAELKLVTDKIDVALRQFELTETAGTPLVSFEGITLEGGKLDLGSREVVVPKLAVHDGRLTAAVDAKGTVNWAMPAKTRETPAQAKPPPDPASVAPAQPWKLRLESFTIDDVALHFTDASRAIPLTIAVGSSQLSLAAAAEIGGAEPKLVTDNIDVALRRFDLTGTAGAPSLGVESITLRGGKLDLGSREVVVPKLAIQKGKLTAAVDAGGTVNWAQLAKSRETSAQAKPAARPESVAPAQLWKVRLESFMIDDVALNYTDASRAIPVTVTVGSSQLSLAATAEAGGTDLKLLTDDIGVVLRRVDWTETDGAPLLGVESITLQGGKLDLAKRNVCLKRLAVEKGSAQLTRATDGTIRQVTALFPSEEGKVLREMRAAGEAAQAEGRPWGFALDQLELSGFALGYMDEITAPAVQYDLEDLNVVVKDVHTDSQTPIAYEARLNVRQGGSASAVGTASQTGDAAEAQVKLDRFGLTPLAPLVSKFADLNFLSGNLSGTIRIKYRAAESGPSLRAMGTVRAGDLLLTEADSRERFLSWKALSADGVDFSLNPNRLAIKEVRLLEPGAKVVIFEDKSVNLAKVLKRDTTPAGETAPAKASPAGGDAAFPVAVDRVRVENAIVDFADLSLILPFATQIRDFNGAATGISSKLKTRTSLNFEGQVGEFGQASVHGSLLPFDPKGFTDITVAFRNVAMTPLSPYSATFAGRKIASGKLNLDLQYKIDKSQMLGDNKIVLQDFTLGEKVESPDATNLPLDLAIALLTDSEGKIDIAVPVRGNVDSPEFSYGQVIGQAIGKTITKIVTSPFRALNAALGGDAESGLATLLFQPGSAALAPPEQEKLKKVSEALAKRPQLKIVVHGGVDPALDGTAIKERNLRRALAQELGESLEPGEDPGPVAYDNAKSQRALEALLAKRDGEEAVKAFEAAFEKQAGRPAKRVNALLAFVGQASEDRDFYIALYKHLVETAPRPDAELKTLAENRGTAVAKELTTQGVEAARVTVGKTEQTEAQDQAVPSKLELDPL
jgi:Domain of Unknown Function (DUF748)